MASQLLETPKSTWTADIRWYAFILVLTLFALFVRVQFAVIWEMGYRAGYNQALTDNPTDSHDFRGIPTKL